MTNFLSLEQLKQALSLKEQIAALEVELNAILGEEVSTPAAPTSTTQVPRRRVVLRAMILTTIMGAAFGVRAQTNFQQLLSFGLPRIAYTPGYALEPLRENGGSPLVVNGQGTVLYGICNASGSAFATAVGDIYSLGATGSGESTLDRIAAGISYGIGCPSPSDSGLTFGPDGALYGASYLSSTNGQVFKLNPDGSGLQTLHIFTTNASADGQLAVAWDGTIFGVCHYGCDSTVPDFIYRLSTNGSGYQVLHQFPPTPDIGLRPFLLIGLDGALYGTTSNDGTNGAGTVFRLSTNGLNYSILHEFFTGGDNLYTPSRGRLAQGSDGNLYGTTDGEGGGYFYGDIYQIHPDGSGYTNFFTFAATAVPLGVVVGADGALYGAASQGGTTNASYTDGSGVLHTNNLGFVFKINKDGTGFTVLHSFGGLDGRNPIDPLIAGASGDFFGVTQFGGDLDRGTVFKLSTAPAPASSIYYFNSDQMGGAPQVQISFSGASSQHWILQGTSNLLNHSSWRTIANCDSDGLLNFGETPSNTNAIGFYRMTHP